MRQLFPAIILTIAFASPLKGQGWADGGMLYAYQPHAGQRAQFDDGYRRHLGWHIERRDSLPWYGWDIIAGRRMDQFVDGTFGVRFEAIDRRVDPQGDAAHAAQTVTPYARATERWAVRVRRDLSTHTPLESREKPARLAQVVTYRVPPGMKAAFERILTNVRASAGANNLFPFTTYETVAGSKDAEFTVMVWRSGMTSFDQPERDPHFAITRALDGGLAQAVRSESELWQFRADLTHVPNARRR